MEKCNSKNDHNNISQLAQERNLPSLLSARELASYLHKSVRWIQLEQSAGHLPKSLKIGRSRFWMAEDVEAWLRSKMGRGAMPMRKTI